MRRTSTELIPWLLLLGAIGLLGLGGCNAPGKSSDYNQGPPKATVTFEVQKPQEAKRHNSSFRANVNSLPSDTGTSMILALADTETFKGDYLAYGSVLDAGLLSLTTNQVTLVLPLNKPVRLVEYTFASFYFSPGEIKAARAEPVSGADLGLVTLTAGTKALSLVSNLTPITAPKSISVTGSVAVGVGATSQMVAYAIYADGSAQDMTNHATWSSSAPTNATVTNDIATSKGVVTGKLPGPATLTATLLGVSGTKVISVETNANSLAFRQLVYDGTYNFSANDDGYGFLDYIIGQTVWGDFGEYFDRYDPHLGIQIPITNPNQRYRLEGGLWVPDTMALVRTQTDYTANKMYFTNPDGWVQLDRVADLANKVSTIDFHGFTRQVPMGPGAKSFDMTFQITYPSSRYLLEQVETTKSGSSGSGGTFPSLEAFLSTNSYQNATAVASLYGPSGFDCTSGGGSCLFFSYTAGQQAGDIMQVNYDGNHNVLSTSVGGSWHLDVIEGKTLLFGDIYDPAFQKGGKGAVNWTLWGVLQGEVHRGWSELPGAQQGTFTEYNFDAAVSLMNYLDTAGPEIFISPWYQPPTTGCTTCNGSSGGGTPTGPSYTPPKALYFDGATGWIGTNTAGFLGIANTFTIAAWIDSTGPTAFNQPILEITDGTANNLISLYIEASTGNLAAKVTDAVNGTSNFFQYVSLTPVPTGGRHLVAMVWDGFTLSLYQDSGVISASPVSSITSSQSDSARSVNIGKDSFGNYFNGKIHSLMVWNSALGTSAELPEIYKSNNVFQTDLNIDFGLYLSSLNLMHWWHFDSDPTLLGRDFSLYGTPTNLAGGTLTQANLQNFNLVDPVWYTDGGLLSPNGGEFANDGLAMNLSWDSILLSGTTVNVYLLTDLAQSYLLDPTAADLADRVSAVNWAPLSANWSNNGLASFDPGTIPGLYGTGYKLLIVSDTGLWDVTDGVFSINTGFPYPVPQGINFNGLSYLGSSTSATLGLSSSFSLSVWFKQNMKSGIQTLLALGDGTATGHIALKLNGGIPQLTISDGTLVTEYLATGTVNTGMGYNLTVTYDGTNPPTMYLDGALLTPAVTVNHTGVAAPVESARLINVGVDQGSVDSYNGEVMGVAIWSSVLTAAEAGSLAHDHRGWTQYLGMSFANYVSPLSLQHWWQFDMNPANFGFDMGIGLNLQDLSTGAYGLTAADFKPYIPWPQASYLTGTLLTPNGGESWTNGVSQNITWNSVSLSTVNVDLYLLDELAPPPLGPLDSDLAYQLSGQGWIHLGTVTNNGTYTFTPTSLPPGSVYRVLIVGDTTGAWDLSDAAFSIF